MIKLISRDRLEYVAKKVLSYPLHDAEKDYFLTLIMELVAQDQLSDRLVFKGGTAIYHCYLDQLRFSEDLDFTASDKNIELKDLKRLFEKYEIFEVVKEYETEPTLKLERIKYFGVLETANSVKLEVDRFQNVALPPKMKIYQNVWDRSFKVRVMDPIEICAEKIRACNDRFRYRDFYDLYMLVDKLELETKEAIELIAKKEIRKPISKENVMRNLSLALQEVSSGLGTIVYKEEVDNGRLKAFFESLELSFYEANVKL